MSLIKSICSYVLKLGIYTFYFIKYLFCEEKKKKEKRQIEWNNEEYLYKIGSMLHGTCIYAKQQLITKLNGFVGFDTDRQLNDKACECEGIEFSA